MYCNDRTIGNGGTFNNVSYGTLGYGANNTLYAAARRIGTGGQSGTTWSSANASPQYDCPNDARDAFTLKVASGGTAGYGNNMLNYPVGLLTADEIAYAGGAASGNNNTYFLYTGVCNWTMTAYLWSTIRFGVFIIVPVGGISTNGRVGDCNNTFPVISLKNNVFSSDGDGHASTPYVIE